MFVIESAAAGCGIPNDSLRKNLSSGPQDPLVIFIFRKAVQQDFWLRVRVSKIWEGGPSAGPAFNCLIFYICVQIYTHPRISQSDFPVMRFVLFNTSWRRQRWWIIPLLAHGNRPTSLPQGKACATRKKEMERVKKKRCGFIMFVIESAAEGCGIQTILWCIEKNQAYGQPRVGLHQLEVVEAEIIDFLCWSWNHFLIFASKYIRIRAFHKAISRSCILLRFKTSRQIW